MSSAFEPSPAFKAHDDPWSLTTLAPDRSPNTWMLSYIDILMLLATLLVVLLAVRKSTLETFPTPTITTEVVTRIQPRHEPQTETARDPMPWNPPDDLKDQVEIIREAEHIRLEVNDAILFESSRADLKVQGQALLEKLVAHLQDYPGRISVEGHTDDQPIATERYPSNWELSSARASMVTRYLITHGIAAHRLQAIGFADTRPRSTDDTEQGRARNRRVTLVLVPPQP